MAVACLVLFIIGLLLIFGKTWGKFSPEETGWAVRLKILVTHVQVVSLEQAEWPTHVVAQSCIAMDRQTFI
jgi:hypothetical protein